MTDKKVRRRKLSHEVLGIFAICFAVAFTLFWFLLHFGVGVVEEYCWQNDISLDENQMYRLDNMVFSISLIASVIFFVVLFLVLFGERLSYIRTIIKGIGTLQSGDFGHKVPIEGNNELTQLAEAINYLSENEREIKDKEKRLNQEKEELIRTLSHDIRTPLTSIMSYTELLSAKEVCTPDEQRAYLKLVGKKTAQIKELTDILLDGGRRDVERFEDARILMEQLAEEFEEMLEDNFRVSVDLSECSSFEGSFDVREMRRIFDNLISNVKKYADTSASVELEIFNNECGITVKQKNAVRQMTEPSDSYRMGINSIRRIAHNYGGGVDIKQDDDTFEIIITLSDI